MKKSMLMMAIAAIAMIGCGPKAAQEKAEGAENAEKAPIRINCLVKVTPENRDAVIALSKELVDSSRTDAGNIDYDLYESANDPSKLIIFETWEDQASLDAHAAAEHSKQHIENTKGLSESKLEKFLLPEE